MFDSKIKSLVIAKIKEKIAKAEEIHKQKCLDIDQESTQRKEAHALELVEGIIGK